MLICVELSELTIYCKYAWKFSVFEIIYYIFLYYTFLPIYSSLTYKRHMSDTPSLKILVSQSSFYDEVLSQNKLTAKKPLTNFAENASPLKFHWVLKTPWAFWILIQNVWERASINGCFWQERGSRENNFSSTTAENHGGFGSD